jgi:hypothetical protein
MIQNLVLGVEFDGTKEKFMIPLNPFITSHRAAIESFLQQITVGSSLLPHLFYLLDY